MMKKLCGLLCCLIFFSFVCGKSTRTLVLGDSNGAASNGWVAQLQRLRPLDIFCNLSISGNTIGFDNSGNDTLNTLRNIDSYLYRGEQALKRVDRILILLGTNDTKKMFDSLQHQVPSNLELVLAKIETYYQGRTLPEIVFISPSPIAEDAQLESKYYGGKERVACLIPNLKRVVEQHQYQFINLHDSLRTDYHRLHVDGIHLNEDGYIRSAQVINKLLK